MKRELKMDINKSLLHILWIMEQNSRFHASVMKMVSSCESFIFIYLYKTKRMQPKPGTLYSERRTPISQRLSPLNPLKVTLRGLLTWNSFSCTSGIFSGSNTLNFEHGTLNCGPLNFKL